MILTQSLGRTFGELVAVDDLSIEVKAGEILGFLGPNGAGKTTTVRMLAGLIQPTSGTAMVNGHNVAANPQAVRQSIGLLTETPGLYLRLSALRNLEIFAGLHGVSGIAARVEKYLRMLKLWDRRRDRVGTFSKGMRQRLAICRALLHEPPLIFLDEPTSALDPESARDVRDTIASLKSAGKTIFLCTHNLAEADALCDRIAVFQSRLLVLDTADNLRHRVFGKRVIIELAEMKEAYLAAAQLVVPEVTADGLRLVVSTGRPADVNPELVRSLVAAGAAVHFVRQEQPSLEDVYLQLIRRGDDA